MSGTDPNGKWFSKKGEPTSPFQPNGSGPEPTLPHDLPKIPGITLHYEIARGGMGVVYSGRQDFLDRRVAVKFLSVDLGGAAFAQRFQREAKILAGISHPNIVGCHMADTTEQGQSYLVMEFCDGPSLKAWVAENGPVAPLAAIRLIRASAMALAHAYQSDIIHRDVKPENILLETVTSTSLDIRFPFTPKIVDLGLARMTHEQVGMGLTSPGSVMGTPSTMSPEQFDDPDSVDFRSDIYGLGCCLYEMLVGQPAFRGGKLTDIVLRKRDLSAPNPCDENPQVPAAVGAFTQRLLACRREDRPDSYKQLDLEANELMTALISQRGRTDTVAGDGMDRTIPSAPGNFDSTRPMGTNAAGAGAGGATQPFQPQQPKSTSPGMLNTGEFEFLAEGGPAGGSQPPSAFQDSGVQQSGLQGTSPTNLAAGAAPAKSKTGLFIGIGAVVLIGGGIMFAINRGPSSGGQAAGGQDPNRLAANNGNGGGQDGSSGAANSAPTVAAIKLMVAGKEVSNATVDLGKTFQLVADAKDADGDELEYSWSWPIGVMHPMSQTGAAAVTFQLDDGLPGVEHVVTLDVGDRESISPTRKAFTVIVGECPDAMPLMGFELKSEWRVDKPDKAWVENMDPIDKHWRGRSRKGMRTLATTLGDEAYWEWHGNLLSEENQEGSFATVGLRFEFGDKAYAIQLNREEKGQLWNMELLEAVRNDDQWSYRSMADVCRARWRQGDGDLDYRGWFSIQRRRNELVVELGEAIQPLRSTESLPPLQITKQPARTIKLPDPGSSAELTLYVDQGIGRFRVLRR